MRVAISENHLKLHNKLIRETNLLSKNFSAKAYSKTENIDRLLRRQDISAESKKQLLAKKLHDLVLRTFSIDRKKFSNKNFDSFKKRLQDIRKIIIKLRSINYYLETAFLEDLNLPKARISIKNPKISNGRLSRGEIGVLEYASYRLIGKAVMLDKRLVKQYTAREEKIIKKEKAGIKDIRVILEKETAVMEHLEAKIVPAGHVTVNLLRDPVFSHWAATVFALLAYLGHLTHVERGISAQLKKNISFRSKIIKKISYIVREKSKLLRIMEQKQYSMGKAIINSKFKKEYHNLIAAIRI